MKRTIEQWTIEEIYKKRDKFIFPEYQRAPKLWKERDKNLLIDSILINMDIPKLYFNQTTKYEYEVVDGQQRLWAIWEFINNEYSYKTTRKDKNLENLNGKKFKDFPNEVKGKIFSYTLQATLFYNASEDYLRKLFIRLQLGLLLITGEKLKASSGMMKDFIFKNIVNKPFMENINIPNRRFAKQTLCAQICINSFAKENIKEFSRTRYEDLEYFFEEYKNPTGSELSFFKERCKHILYVFDILDSYFDDKAKLLRNRSYILSIYLFVEEMIKTHSKNALKVGMPEFVKFSLLLLSRLREEAQSGFYRKNEELYRFESYLSNAPGEKYQIENRHNKLKDLYKYFRKTGRIKGDRK